MTRTQPSRFGILALMVCLAALVAYLAWWHETGIWVAVRAVGALYFLGVIPGYVVLRHVVRLRSLTPFESLLSALVLGSLLTPGVWYLLCWVGASAMFWPVVLGAGLILPVIWGWRGEMAERLSALVTPRDAPILFVALGMVALWSHTIRYVDVESDQVAIKPHYDLCYHAIQTDELARGTPTERVPFLSTRSRISYHHLPDVWSDLLRQATGADPSTAFLHLALPLRYFLLSIAAYLGLLTRFGRGAALAGVVCLLAFVEPAQFTFPKSFLHYLHFSYPTVFGLSTVFLMLHFASHVNDQNRRRILPLVCFLSGLLCYYKVNQALVVIPGGAIFAGWITVRARDYKGLVLCVAALGVPAALMLLESTAADVKPPIELSPFTFLSWWWQQLALPGGMKPALASIVDAMPTIFRWPLILAICVVQRFHVGILIVGYLLLACGWARANRSGRPVDRLICLILASSVVGFAIMPVHRNLVWNVGMHSWAVVTALSMALMGPAVYDACRRVLATRRVSVVAMATVVLLGAAGHNAFALRRVAQWETSGSSGYVSHAFYDCCRFIDRTAPANATVLHPLYRENLFVSLLTKRRSVIDYAWLCGHLIDADKLIADVDAYYAGADARTALSTLSRLRVNYVIVDSIRGGELIGEPSLTPVFRSGETSVYSVNRDVLAAGIATSPPTPLELGESPTLARRVETQPHGTVSK